MAKILVIGLGVSGLAAAEFLLYNHYQVIGVDARIEHLLSQEKVRDLQEKGLIILDEKAALDLFQFDFIVISPGIVPSHPLCEEARKIGLRLVGEAELALQNCKQKAVAITGTNGKTTVALLTAHILNSNGIKARPLGNIGEPFSAYFLNPDPKEIIIAELSSYQLETLEAPIFDSGIILNITPDHLDRYQTMESYAQAKCLLQRNLKEGSWLYVYDQVIKEFGIFLNKTRCRTFGKDAKSYFWTDRKCAKHYEEVEYFLPLSYRDLGIHESENVLASWILIKEFGISKEQFLKAVTSFKKSAHRIEFIASIDGVDYFDDSKGTNLDAVTQAVHSMNGPVILIAGGVDKGASYQYWIKSFKDRVKDIIVLGQAAEKMYFELKDHFKMHRVETLERAVLLSRTLAQEGDAVLLSPGCSSFDMFRDYTHRGEEFQNQVRRLKEEN